MENLTEDHKDAHTERYDVAIAGAGPAGLFAALNLGALGLRTICAGPAFSPDPEHPDTRTTALMQGSVDLLRSIGVWGECAPFAAPLKALRMIDDTGRLLRAPDVYFSSQELGPEPFGYNMSNRHLVRILHERLDADPNASYLASEGVVAVEPGADSVTLRLKEGRAIEARLVIGADGKNSLCRDAAGIGVQRWNYDQTAIALNFHHSLPHNLTCVVLHRPAGQFTVVPLPGNVSSLVWVERPDEAARLMALSDTAIAAEIEKRTQRMLGKVGQIEPRAAFPLSGLVAKSLGRNRIALVGESAHVAPPVGAQGLNLGFRDVEALTTCLRDAAVHHRDIGADAVLDAYTRARRGDVFTRVAAADMLNRTLIAGYLPFQLMRGAGLTLLKSVGPLRRFVMREGIEPQISLLSVLGRGPW
jgi:2-octaprenyl-6-methoxyphenol hydroxylase